MAIPFASPPRQDEYEDVEYVPLAADPEHAAADAAPKAEQDEALSNISEESMAQMMGLTLAYAFGFAFITCTWMIMFTSHPLALGWFFWHPLLLSLAVVLFTYGIVTLQPTSQAQPAAKVAGLSRHQLYMFAFGFPALIMGIFAVSYTKHLRGASHFTTWHGRFGLMALCWICMQIVLGGGSVWANGRLFGGNPGAKRVWKVHRLSGYVLFALLLITAHLGGAWSDFAQKNAVPFVRLLAFTISPALLAGGVFARVRLSKMKFF